MQRKTYSFGLKKWEQAHLKKIAQLIEDIKIQPFTGIGKPEAFKHNLSGCWSRRINLEHRLVYEIKDDNLLILSERGHYLKP